MYLVSGEKYPAVPKYSPTPEAPTQSLPPPPPQPPQKKKKKKNTKNRNDTPTKNGLNIVKR